MLFYIYLEMLFLFFVLFGFENSGFEDSVYKVYVIGLKDLEYKGFLGNYV